MIFPNKLIPFKDSVISKMVFVLDVLVSNDEDLTVLYDKIIGSFDDVNQYILTLDILFALEKVQLNEELKVIKYVKTNNL